MPSFPDSFFDALGAWQNGWDEKPELQAPIREALLREASLLSEEYKLAPPVLFRKRHLYKTDVLALARKCAIDDGACSWTTSREFADRFKDEWRPNAATGTIIRHRPRPQDIILNIPSLWDDPEFVADLEDYEKRGGVGADAIRHFRGPRNQFEVIATCPLIITDIIRFSGKVGEIDPVLEQAGIEKEEDIDQAYLRLGSQGIYEGSIMKLQDDAAQRIVQRVLVRWETIFRQAENSSTPK